VVICVRICVWLCVISLIFYIVNVCDFMFVCCVCV